MSTTRSTVRTAGVAVRAMLVFTLVLGIGYTALVTAIGQLALPWQANGALVTDAEGTPVGSALIGQSTSRISRDSGAARRRAAPRGAAISAEAMRAYFLLRSAICCSTSEAMRL